MIFHRREISYRRPWNYLFKADSADAAMTTAAPHPTTQEWSGTHSSEQYGQALEDMVQTVEYSLWIVRLRKVYALGQSRCLLSSII